MVLNTINLNQSLYIKTTHQYLEAGIAYLSGKYDLTHIFSVARVVQSLVLYVVF